MIHTRLPVAGAPRMAKKNLEKTFGTQQGSLWSRKTDPNQYYNMGRGSAWRTTGISRPPVDIKHGDGTSRQGPQGTATRRTPGTGYC